jgi:HAD superfamily hydrolase (TIGR01509 family)
LTESEATMPIKAILFDIDGTLVDSNDEHVLAWDEVFRDEGTPFDRQLIHDQIGKGADNLVPTLLPDSDEADQDRLGEAHGKIFKAKYLDQVQPFPGARDLIARVHAAGQKVVLASSASQSELDHYLDLLDVRDLVTASTSADDVENTKPAPDIFATALKKIALQPDEVMVVGDTPYDVAAAGKCGIGTVALRSGKFDDASLKEVGAVCIYDDVAALLADYGNSPIAG